jgi:hypothetical protein
MPLKSATDKFLLYLVCGVFLWFFASSLSIAYHKFTQHDDAMFATIPKNLLNGYGWATSYGEKIPFNPDISTGPTLLLPTMFMLATFGNQPWVPAVTGTLINIIFTCLVLWQLSYVTKNRAAAYLALLLSVSLFAVNDFKTLTAYYAAGLLFLFALLFSLNRNYYFIHRSFIYGSLAALGLYAKPLILLSFLIAAPCIVFFEQGIQTRKYSRFILCMLLGFMVVFVPWHIYKKNVLSGYSKSYQAAHHVYAKQFFENHGTGIGQLKNAKNKFNYLQLNTKKNYRILRKFLHKENNYPIYILFVVIGAALFMSARALIRTRSLTLTDPVTLLSSELCFSAILALVIFGNLSWYIFLSFAMTPGHAFFLAFFSFVLFFMLMATLSRSNSVGIFLCLLSVLFFQVRIPPLIEAYRFKIVESDTNSEIINTAAYLQTHKFRYPLASCGYIAAPYRLEYLLPKSQNFVDCYNVLEDSLALDETGSRYYWRDSPSFTFAVEALSFLAAAQSQGYVLEPIAEACQKNILFSTGMFIVCEVEFDAIRPRLDATEAAKVLVDYQGWYRTRIKVD